MNDQTRHDQTKAERPRGGESENPYAIVAAESLQEMRTLTMKQGDMFAVFNRAGDIRKGAGRPEGVFNCDTRHLSQFLLTMGGIRPMLLSATLRDDNALLTCDLANPDLPQPNGQPSFKHDCIHIRRSRFLWDGSCLERIAARNFDQRHRSVDLELEFAADFADVFEVRGTHRAARGALGAPEVGADQVKLSYEGLDGQRRETIVRFNPAPTRLSSHRACFSFDLAPGEWRSLFVEIACGPLKPQSGQRRFLVALRDSQRALHRSSSRAATMASTNDSFNETVRRSVSDLYMLLTQTPEGPYPYAGVPWFSTVFGRDGLITALQTLWLDPAIARGVLGHLAATQATTVDPHADAEPGKILHEARNGEMAILGEVPFRRYYGSVDSTPLFVLLAGLYVERTNDGETLAELWPAIEAALRWIDGAGDPDKDGFVEYQRASEQGLANQGWKDSFDAIFHADGKLAEGDIALAEVQGYVFAGKQLAARCAARLGKHDRAKQLETEARQLAERFEQAFWCDDLGTYALALDGDKKPCRVRTSNAGQLLFSGMIRPDRARLVAADLMRPDFFTGWGIRTVARGEARYNPMSYHDGSIWPHDNALIALGFARYGLKHSVAHVFKALFDAATYMDLRRLPELFCGFRREKGRGPTLYPVACAPQAWASATPFTLLEAALGLEFDAAHGEIRLRNPRLPAFLNDVVLRDLQLGASSVDLRVRRHDEDVSLEVLRTRGEIRVSIVLAH